MVERYRIFAFTTFYRADSMASPLRAIGMVRGDAARVVRTLPQIRPRERGCRRGEAMPRPPPAIPSPAFGDAACGAPTGEPPKSHMCLNLDSDAYAGHGHETRAAGRCTPEGI